jgi:hypothetical protein
MMALAGGQPCSASVTANPASLSYGSVPLGLQTARVLVLTNSGTSAEQVQSFTFSDPDQYGIADGVFPITLNPQWRKFHVVSPVPAYAG